MAALGIIPGILIGLILVIVGRRPDKVSKAATILATLGLAYLTYRGLGGLDRPVWAFGLFGAVTTVVVVTSMANRRRQRRH